MQITMHLLLEKGWFGFRFSRREDADFILKKVWNFWENPFSAEEMVAIIRRRYRETWHNSNLGPSSRLTFGILELDIA